MIHTTRWTPDTCDCVLEYTWDDAVDPSVRTHTYARHVAICATHAAIGAPTLASYTKVTTENSRKNRIMEQITNLLPTLTRDNVSWTWNADRSVLTITLINFTLTTQQRNVANNWITNNLGAGAVVIV